MNNAIKKRERDMTKRRVDRSPELIIETRYGRTIFNHAHQRIVVITENRQEFLSPIQRDTDTIINQVRDFNFNQLHKH